MTSDELASLLAARETLTVEFKEDVNVNDVELIRSTRRQHIRSRSGTGTCPYGDT